MKVKGYLLLLLILGGISTAKGEEWIYSVGPGDNLWTIARQYLKNGNDWHRVGALNGISDWSKLSVGMRLRIPFDWLKWQPVSATVLTLSGDCFVILSINGQKQAITAGLQLNSGDTILTGDNSGVVLQFADDSKLFIRAHSEVVLDSVSVFGETGMVDTHLRLKRGAVENNVKPQDGSGSRYRITTPSATAAVRGTVFRVSADAGVMRSEVLKGGVQIVNDLPGPVVDAGFGLRAKLSEPLSTPVKLLPKPDLSALADSFVHPAIVWQWPELAKAISYRVQLAVDHSFQTLLVNQVTDKASITLTDLEDGQYVMRIRGIDALGLEGIDAYKTVSLTAGSLTPDPASSGNQGGIFLSLGQLGFTWADTKTAVAFHFQLALDSGFQQLRVDQTQLQDNRFILSQKLPQGRYFWRVSGLNQSGQESDFCPVQSFTVGTPINN